MSHYRFLDPEVKERAFARGINLEKTTDDFLRSIRSNPVCRPDLWEQLYGLMTGPPLSAVDAVDERFGMGRVMVEDHPLHGTDTGYHYGCRLECCTAAHAEAGRRWRASRAKRAA